MSNPRAGRRERGRAVGGRPRYRTGRLWAAYFFRIDPEDPERDEEPELRDGEDEDRDPEERDETLERLEEEDEREDRGEE